MMDREWCRKMLRRFSAAVLSAVMLSSALPFTAFAEEDNTEMSAAPLPSSEEMTVAPLPTGEAIEIREQDADLPTEETTEANADGVEVKIGDDRVSVRADEEWKDPGIDAEDTPTVAAPAVESFSSLSGKTGGTLSNMYTLSVATGMNSGETVEYFAIRYTDENNDQQTKYLFPETSLSESYEYLNSEQYTNTDITNRHYILSQRLGYVCNKPDANEYTNRLKSWSVDELLFTTEKPIKAVNSIDVFMGKGDWTVQGMTLSRVTAIHGAGEYGFVTGKYFYGMEKKAVCKMEKLRAGTLTLTSNGSRLVRIGGSGSSYFRLNNDIDEQSDSSPFNDVYTFRIDFADSIDGGLESLLRSNATARTPLDSVIVEDLALEIEYRDKSGYTRNVTMPVLLSALAQLAESKVDVRTVGLAQRGDTLAFSGLLPEFSSLISTRIYVGSAARNRLIETGGIFSTESVEVGRALDGSELSDAANSQRLERIELRNVLENDQIGLSSVSIYKGTCQMCNTPNGTDRLTGESLESYSYTYSYSSKEPLFYFTTTSPEGYRINPGTSDTIPMTYYKEGDPLIGAARDKNFLLTMKTADAEGADTAGDVLVRITYQTISGDTKTTPAINARTEMQDSLGYWPSSKDVKGDFAYRQATARGGYIQIPFTLEQAVAITNVEIFLNNDADEWKLESMCISVLYDESRRLAFRQDVKSKTDASSFRFVRVGDQVHIAPFPLLINRLFLAGKSASIAMQSGYLVDTSSEVDYSSVRYSMTYDQAMMNLGYTSKKKIYDVTVKVADDPDSSNANGDSGSSNYFYFQLQFKNGNSALVLANQQLTSDSFRSGYEETFSIAVNRNYGDLVKVRIIPEDIDSKTDSFDKLNIDRITVTEQAFGGAAMQYVIDPVGWIGIDYRDPAEKQKKAEQAPRYFSDLASDYQVNYQQRVVSFLCEVSTQPWDSEFEYDYKQVTGSISCDLEYVDTNDQPQTVSFDVISRMAAYMEKTAISYDGKNDGSNAALYTNMKTVSDPEWMLRPNHTDRFILPALANVQSIKSMTFYATSRNNKPGKWVIGGVSLSRITKDTGTIDLTKSGEYIRGLETERYCKWQTDKEKLELYMPAGMMQSLTIGFEENTLAWRAENDTSWITSVTRQPETANDRLNLFVYPSPGCEDINGVSVCGIVQYMMSYSTPWQVREGKLETYNSGKSDAMFYKLGMKADDFQTISALVLQCKDTGMSFDRAVVQQVRDDVVVNTYQFDLGGSTATFYLTKTPRSKTDVIDPKAQKMLLSFGVKTVDAHLVPEKSDIAVSFEYRSTLDHGENKFWSPYVYLTDVGINDISPGLMAEIPFDVPAVQSITGYRIVSYGNLNARINSALITNYSYATGSDNSSGTSSATGERTLKREESYSFDSAYEMETGRVYLPELTATGIRGIGSLTPLELTFKTAKAQASGESGTNTQVMMYFTYRNSYNAMVQARYNDITQYIQSNEKKFLTDGEQTIRVLLPDCISLESILINPVGSNGMANWTIERIHGSISFGDIPIDRQVNKEFMQVDSLLLDDDPEQCRISVKDVYIATSINANGELRNVINRKASIAMEGGTSGHINVNVFGGNGYIVKAVWLINGTETDKTRDIISNVSPSGFDFTVPVNDSNEAYTYAIQVMAQDNDAVSNTIQVTVPISEKENDGQDQDDIKVSVNVKVPGAETEQQETTEPTMTAPPAPSETSE